MREQATEDGSNWYVLYTKKGQEFVASENLQRQGYTYFLPTLNVEKIKKGKLETCVEPLFSRYMFIHLSSASGRWSPVRNTRGISRFLSFGERFATVPEDCIEALKKGPVGLSDPLFRAGDRVTVLDGPLAGLQGIYEIMDGTERATVLVELLHQPQRLKIPVTMLHKHD